MDQEVQYHTNKGFSIILILSRVDQIPYIDTIS